MNIYSEINLPQPSKYLVSLLLKRGGKLTRLEGTNVYIIKFKGKELIFFGDFTPLIPYMYGIIFSNQKHWFEILKHLKIKFAWESKKDQKTIKFMITKNGFYNALLEDNIKIKGDGKSNVKKLLTSENIKRINSKDKLALPIKISLTKKELAKIPGKNVTLELQEMEYQNITEIFDKKFVLEVKKILENLPGLPFLSFDLFVKDAGKITNYTFGKVSVTPGENIFLDLTNGRINIPAGKILTEYVLK